jgi:hypothetical protein
MTSSNEIPTTWRVAVLAVSLIAAAVSFFLPAMFPYGDYTRTLLLGAAGSLTWFVLCCFSLVRWKRRGAWTLLGGPFALFYPLGIFMAFVGCARGGPCL